MSDPENNPPREQRTPRPSGEKWPGQLVLLVILTFLCAAAFLALYIYKPTKHVRLVVTTTRVEFNSSASDLEKLIKALDTSSIQVLSAVRLNLGHGWIQLAGQPQIQAQDAFLDMPDANASMTISGPPITRVQFPNESKYGVSLGWLDSSPNVVQVAFRPAETVFLSPLKNIQIVCDYCLLRGLEHADLPGPVAFTFVSQETQGHEVSFALRGARFKGALSLSSFRPFTPIGIPIEDAPRFERAEGDQMRSAILGGKITINDDEAAHELAPSALISVTGAKDFKIHEIRIENGLKVTASAEVEGLLISGRKVLPTPMHISAEMITALATVGLIFATLYTRSKESKK